MSSTCRYMRGRTLIRRRPGSSLVLALPAAEIGRGELVTMAHSDFGHTGRITSTLLDFTADVVVAVGPGHKRLQLLHGHGEPPEGFLTANQAWREKTNPSVFLPQSRACSHEHTRQGTVLPGRSRSLMQRALLGQHPVLNPHARTSRAVGDHTQQENHQQAFGSALIHLHASNSITCVRQSPGESRRHRQATLAPPRSDHPTCRGRACREPGHPDSC